MPNIFKHFLGPVNSYVFPEADQIPMDDPPPPDDPEPEEGEDASQEETAQSDQDTAAAEDGAAALFSYARVQADEIVAQARKEGEALLEDLRRQAAQEAEQARAAAQEEGFRQGYAQGLEQARAESKSAMEEQLRQQGKEISAFLEKVSQAREELIDQTRDELCDLSVAVAEKIIHVSLKSSHEVIARMIQMATDRLRRREWVHIYVGGCDSRELAQITPELTAALSGLSDHIKIIPLADDESGTCIIEMPDAIIDASVSTQLQNLKDLMHGG